MTLFRVRVRAIATIAAAALVIGAVLAGPASAAAPSKPAPSFTAVLTTDGACTFTLTATWPASSKVGTVYAMWYFDDAFLFTMQAPFTGPNAGTIKGRTATFVPGPFTDTGVDHSLRVLTQFYSGAGAQLWSMDSNTIVSHCGLATP